MSRTAISKWESGRGYPSIDSLKEISHYFSVSIDDLLSSDEILCIAEKDNEENEKRLQCLVFGLLDVSVLMFFFLPFFGHDIGGTVRASSLLALSEIAFYLKVLYYTIVIAIVLSGILSLAFQNCKKVFLTRISLVLNATAVLLFMISPQPYACVLLFIFLAIKGLLLIKWQ